MQAIRQLACVSIVALVAFGCGSDDSDGGGGNEAGTAGAESVSSGGSGTAGDTGEAGEAGNEHGTGGDSGTAGSSGSSGAPGTAGTGETAGTPGTAGTAGTAGTPGTAGTAGTAETAGTAGTVASAGTAGSSGSGTAGTTATAGSSGSTGSAGSAGAPAVPTMDAGGAAGDEIASSDFAQIEGAEFTDGDAPEASSDVAAPDLIAPDTVINGGTATYTVEVPEGAVLILVKVDGDSGYYTIPVTSTTGTQTFDLTLLQGFEGDSVEVDVATMDGEGGVSAWTKHPIPVVQTQGGAIKVSLSFDANEDLDLAVADPNGDLVYFNVPESVSGGTLDLDSNAGCNIDGVNNENIYWAEGDALPGEYIVYVSWYGQCDDSTTQVNATVTATVGDDVYTQTVLFTPDMVCPSTGCEMANLVAVGTFTY